MNFFRVLTLVLMVSLAACKTARKVDDSGLTSTSSAIDENTLGDSDSGRAMGLKTIRFPYDSFAMSGEAKADLKTNAEILKDKTALKVQIEGHCDQRGGIQYNIALGEKRANAVKQGLLEMGIKEDRLSTISYGKERLLDQGTSEEAHAKNRRANFAITSK